MTTQTLAAAAEPQLLLAQAAPEGGGGGLGFFLPMIALFLVMYAIIIHPQRKQQKEHRQMLSQVERGDRVVTTGGLMGKVTGITDDILTVEIAHGVKVKLKKSAVASRESADGKKS